MMRQCDQTMVTLPLLLKNYKYEKTDRNITDALRDGAGLRSERQRLGTTATLSPTE